MCNAKKRCVGPVGQHTYFGRNCRSCEKWYHWSCVPPTKGNLAKKTLTCWHCHKYRIDCGKVFDDPKETQEFRELRQANESLANNHVRPEGLLPFDCFRGHLTMAKNLPFVIPDNFDRQRIADYNFEVYNKLTDPYFVEQLQRHSDGTSKWLAIKRSHHGLPFTDIDITDKEWLQAHLPLSRFNEQSVPSRLRRKNTSERPSPKKKKGKTASSANNMKTKRNSLPSSVILPSDTETPALKKRNCNRNKNAAIPKDDAIDATNLPSLGELTIFILRGNKVLNIPYHLAIVRSKHPNLGYTECQTMNCIQTGDLAQAYIDMIVWKEDKSVDAISYVSDEQKVLYQFVASELLDITYEDGCFCGRLRPEHLLCVLTSLFHEGYSRNELVFYLSLIDRLSRDIRDDSVIYDVFLQLKEKAQR